VGGGIILCFGGGASLSNRLGLLDTSHWTFTPVHLLRPQRQAGSGGAGAGATHGAPLVRPRVSHAAVLARSAGRLLVHGGWNGRELGDLLALDLAPVGMGGPWLAQGQARSSDGHGEASEEASEEEEGEEEEEDDDDDHPPRSIECAQS
jgi:hypothetical protein